MRVLDAARRLRDAARDVEPVGRARYVYHPLEYAWPGHEAYVQRYGDARAPRRVLLVGMNPGPWGMGQTGVPFGDVVKARAYLGIEAPVGQPPRAHPKRPVLGFAATRREGSGRNLWTWAESAWGAAARFHETFYVTNYCPLLFFDAEGRNLTPAQVGEKRLARLYEACDTHLVDLVRALRPQFLVGLGAYAERHARRVAQTTALDVVVRGVIHPSPVHPANNFGWKPDFSFLG